MFMFNSNKTKSKIWYLHLTPPPRVKAAVSSKAAFLGSLVVDSLLIVALSVGFRAFLCFVVHHFMSLLVLQSS